eukprot:scaffold2100_cov87-Cylindrotheca_fusiformis.AAC.1
MEETDLHKPLLPEPQEDVFVDEASPEEEDKQCGAPSRKVRFGLIALVLVAIATAAVMFHLFFYACYFECRSKMELMATVVMPGVKVSDLHWFAPQYRALRWLACKDPRHMTIDDDATELLERFSLVTLYYFAGGDSWRKSKYRHDWSRWLTTLSHCAWDDDFDCDEVGRVTILQTFHGMNVHGTLPTEIGNLKGLRDLDLWNNRLEGPIPSEIGHLQQLKHLALSFNELSGPIPSEIGHLQQLRSLSLRENSFSGPIPSEIGQLQQLESLGLGENKLSGPIPSEIGNLQQLYYLGLGGNMFSGPIPSEIGNLQQLHDLILSHNIGLTGTVPVEVGQLKSIWYASFFNTSLTGGLDDLAF